MVCEPGDAVGKSWPKESGSSRSRFRGTAKRSPPNSIRSESLGEHVSAEEPTRKRSKDSHIEVVAFDSTFIEVATGIEDIFENRRDRSGGAMVVE
jgi:hypothetical protein